MMGFELRPYQYDIIGQIRAHMKRGTKKILVHSPTGSGKTVLTAKMLETSAQKKMRSIFIVHRRELTKQSIKAFEQTGVHHGVVASGFPIDPRPYVQIASVQTLARRLHSQRTPTLIVWDECHHVAAGSWDKIFKTYPDAFHIGLTATPERLDGKGLGAWFDVMVSGPSITCLIDNKFLSPYRLFAPSKLSLKGVRTQMGDYKKSDLNELIDKPKITGSALKEYRKTSLGKRAVVFCVSIKHSQHVVDEFNKAGISALHVDGETPIDERDRAIRDFSEGKVSVLSNVELFGEGFDLPSIEVVILLRPTKSLGLYLQQVGRALRPFPGKKEAIILDHVGNCERHGLPDDSRQWSLLGRAGRAQKVESLIKVKICENCFAAQSPGRDSCKFCNQEFEKHHREIEHVDGELVEVGATEEAMAKKKNTKTIHQLIAIGKKRGYKRPHMWAKHIFNKMQEDKLKGAGNGSKRKESIK